MHCTLEALEIANLLFSQACFQPTSRTLFRPTTLFIPSVSYCITRFIPQRHISTDCSLQTAFPHSFLSCYLSDNSFLARHFLCSSQFFTVDNFAEVPYKAVVKGPFLSPSSLGFLRAEKSGRMFSHLFLFKCILQNEINFSSKLHFFSFFFLFFSDVLGFLYTQDTESYKPILV